MIEHPLPVEEEVVPPPPAEERRVSARLPSAQEATCRKVADEAGRRWEARIRDVSEYGVGLVLAQTIDPGTLLAIDLESPGGAVRSVLARVVHVTLLDSGEWVAGCAFVAELTDE